jgi:hypothetical protein
MAGKVKLGWVGRFRKDFAKLEDFTRFWMLNGYLVNLLNG